MDTDITVNEIPEAEPNPCAGCAMCCECFSLSMSGKFVKNLLKDDPSYMDDCPDPRLKKWVEEDVVELTQDEAIATGIFSFTAIRQRYEIGGALYRCSLLDTETKLCTDYENRPDPCRNFPKGPLDVDAFQSPCNLSEEMKEMEDEHAEIIDALDGLVEAAKPIIDKNDGG